MEGGTSRGMRVAYLMPYMRFPTSGYAKYNAVDDGGKYLLTA